MSRDKTTCPLRVASYNIRKTRGLDQRYNPHRIISVINRLEADVLALQEADHRLGERPAAIDRELIERETDYIAVPVSQNDISVGWHGNAVLLRKGMTVNSVEHFDLPGFEPRGAVRVDIDAGVQVSVVATHLGLLRNSRRMQLSKIARELMPVERSIILGDFNEWKKKRGLEALAGRYDVHSPGRSFHAARPIAALDRIAVTKKTVLYDAGVDESEIARQASDHLPIWADLEFSETSGPSAQ